MNTSNTMIELLKRLYDDGNINQAIEVWDQKKDELWDIMPELWSNIHQVIKAFPHHISRKSWHRLRGIAIQNEANDIINDIEILSRIKREKPEENIGFIWFPVFSNHGHVLGLRVVERGNNDVQEKRLKLLDEVGSAVYSTIRSHLRIQSYIPWRPDLFSFQIINMFGEEVSNVTGRSLALPLALALYSKTFRIPIPSNLSASADVKRNGSVVPIHSLKQKLEVISKERPNISKVLIAHGQQGIAHQRTLIIEQCSTLEEAIEHVFKNCLRPSLKDYVGIIDVENETLALQKIYEHRLYNTCTENATELIKYLQNNSCPVPNTIAIRALFTSYWRRGSCYCHLGDADRSIDDFSKAHSLSLRRRNILRPDEYINSRINLAVLLKDLFRYKEAEALHEQIRNDLDKGMGSNIERVKNESSWSQLCLAMRKFSAAETKQLKAIDLNQGGWDLFRNFNYLGQIYTRWGRFKDASKAFRKANTLYESATYFSQNSKRNDKAFLDLYRAEYLYHYGNTLKNRKAVLDELLKIDKVLVNVNNWIRPTASKWLALAFLWNKHTVDRGMMILEDVCSYFASEELPILKLIEVTGRAERVLFFLNDNFKEPYYDNYGFNMYEDIHAIIHCLRLDKNIERYFSDIIRNIENINFERTKGRSQLKKQLSTVLLRIPF
ncbi:MAG: tetratricopeptide repeat protein [Syntrophales bacterium]